MKLYKSLMQLYNIWVIVIQITPPPPPKKKLRPNSLTKQEKELKSLLRMFLQVQYFDHKEPSSQVSRHLYGGLMKLLKIKKKPNVRINQNVDNDSNICSR